MVMDPSPTYRLALVRGLSFSLISATYAVLILTSTLSNTTSIYNNLKQLVQLPTRVPDRIGDKPNTLDLFMTSNASTYSVKLFPPLGPPISFLFLFLLLLFQVFRRNDPRLQRGKGFGITMLQTGLTCGRTSLIFHGMITVFAEGVPLIVLSAIPR